MTAPVLCTVQYHKSILVFSPSQIAGGFIAFTTCCSDYYGEMKKGKKKNITFVTRAGLTMDIS